MSTTKDVVIIGAGVIGCSIAYHLARQGITSQIIERESIGARASGKAWAVIAYPPIVLVSEKKPDTLFTLPEGETSRHWLELYWWTYTRIADIAIDLKEKGGIDIELGEHRYDNLAFSEEEEAYLKHEISRLREMGHYEIDWVDAKELKAVYPHVNPKVRGAFSVPMFQVEPYKYTLGYAQAAEKMGAEVRQGEAVGFKTKGGKITSVKLDSGADVEADAVVLAMGPWSGQGSSWLGKEIPMRIVMEQCLRMEVPERLPLHAIKHGKYAIIPKVNGDVILGMAGDLRLLKDDFDSRLSEEIKIEIMEGAVDILPGLEDAKLVEYRGDLQGWAPAPAYVKPLMGRLPEWENGYIAARFSTLGMCQSAGAGKFMADLIAGGQTPLRARHMMEYISPARAM